MQQAYRALRIISEAQTVHIILAAQPDELMLTELRTACESLRTGSDGIKAVILDFAGQASARPASLSDASELLARTGEAVHAIPQPVLGVVRASLSEIACQLVAEADFILVAHEAELCLPAQEDDGVRGNADQSIGGLAAARLGYATWTAAIGDLEREMERILDMLRAKSALALRLAKASVRLGQQMAGEPMEALRQVNRLYLERVMKSEDAHEGLKAFLEKRPPRWQNR